MLCSEGVGARARQSLAGVGSEKPRLRQDTAVPTATVERCTHGVVKPQALAHIRECRLEGVAAHDAWRGRGSSAHTGHCNSAERDTMGIAIGMCACVGTMRGGCCQRTARGAWHGRTNVVSVADAT